MPAPSVTNTFSNGTTADATEVNTNFNDLVLALSDGTKDITVLSLSTVGDLTVAGDSTIGNSIADSLIVNAAIGSDLLPTTATYNLGGASNAFAALFLDQGATDGGSINFNSSTSTNLKASTDGATLTGTGITSLVGSFKNFIHSWVNFAANTGTPVITDSFNVSSITDNGVGDFTVNLTTAHANANFAVCGSTSAPEFDVSGTGKTTTAHRIVVRTSAGAATDATLIYAATIGAR